MEFTDGRVQLWQGIWKAICEMAFYRNNILEEITILPKNKNEIAFYERNKARNLDSILFETTYKTYTCELDDVQVVPELKKLVVPQSLFYFLGVRSFFKYSFPNCVITFWEDMEDVPEL